MAPHEVAGLQVALYRFGHYKGPIDGIAGPMTNRAVVAFQRERKLEADGKVGKQTRVALGRYGRPLFGVRTLRRGKVGFDVSVLQFLLAKHGLPPKRLNSNFGPATEELVRRFQRKAGLPVDGIVGKVTRAALVTGKQATKKTLKATKRHVVKPGETLTAIAERNGTSVRELASRNKLDPSSVLLIGARLIIPKGQTVARRTSVTASIDRWAVHYGVSPKLARALAWQESGFQPQVRSSVGAVGVMQVIPATRSFVELFVIGQPVPRTTDGNIRVGVAYLDHLLREFEGNVRRALGAYYQGPAAVREDGFYPETRRFVANVLALRGRV
jgi:peptidoglycan hydrolase-like protein with peptidoglycan-binding domain